MVKNQKIIVSKAVKIKREKLRLAKIINEKIIFFEYKKESTAKLERNMG